MKKETKKNASGNWAFLYSPAAAFFLIAAATLIAYGHTLSYPFHLDDIRLIVNNQALRSFSAFWPPSGSRDIGYLSFALNYRFGGLDVFGYHLVNTIVHCLNGFLVWWLVTLIFRSPAMERAGGGKNPHMGRLVALAAAMIFVTHPVQTQAVTYIIQRFASLATLFYLLSVALYLRARLSLSEGEGFHRTGFFFVAAVLSALLAMKTKEISFTLPFAICLCELIFFKGAALKRSLYVIPFLLTLPVIPLSLIPPEAAVVEEVAIAGGEVAEAASIFDDIGSAAREAKSISRGSYLLTQFRVITTYTRLLFLPVNQNLDYEYPLRHSLFEPAVLLSFLFLLTIFSFAVYLLIRSRKTGNGHGLLVSFGILWFFLTLSVESSIVPIRDVIFEHRLYLPSAGAIVAFSGAVFYLFDYAGIKKSWAAAAVLIVLTAVPLGAAAYARNLVWKDLVSLWGDVVAKSPGNARGYSNLGYAYYYEGRPDEAALNFEKATTLRPDLPEPHYNLGVVYSIRGRHLDAVGEYKKALALKPDYARARNKLGNAYYLLGRVDEAIEEYRTAIRIRPGFAEAHNNLGNSYDAIGLAEEAIREYKEALNLNPSYAEARNNLGTAYGRKGLLDMAITELTAAARLAPDHVEPHYNLALAYRKKGMREEEIREFQEVLRIDPDDAGALRSLRELGAAPRQ
ncbi:MAG: tetratricopeptide repeat protein [Thermodesulfobacteriota bacterium]